MPALRRIIFYSIFIAVVAYVIGLVKFRSFFAEDPCSPTEDEYCFFASSYFDAAALFKRSALMAGAELVGLPVYKELNTTVAVLRGDPERYLVHVSGTHGVEAPAGSAIQSSILQQISINKNILNSNNNDNSTSDLNSNSNMPPTLVFVHALNPYGFAFNRRVNEDNVDLNRNFLSSPEFEMVKARDPNYSGYVDFDLLVNPTKKFQSSFLNIMSTLFQTVRAVSQHGITPIKRAMVAGNYHKQNGYGFGGFSRTKSVENLIKYLALDLQIPTKAKRVALIDVHTGLGPEGVDTLLMSHAANVDPLVATRFPTEFDPATGEVIGGLREGAFKGTSGPPEPQKEQGPPGAVSAGYEFTIGTLSGNFCENVLAHELGGKDRMCITQEFGTVPAMVVGLAGVEENYAHHHGSEADKDLGGWLMSSCFYVKRKNWQRSIVDRGSKVFFQALAFLNE